MKFSRPIVLAAWLTTGSLAHEPRAILDYEISNSVIKKGEFDEEVFVHSRAALIRAAPTASV